MRQLGVSVLIGAALSSGFRSSVGAALGGIGEMDRGLDGLQRRVLDLGQAWAGIAGLRSLTDKAMTLSDDLKDAAITADLTDEAIGGLATTLRNLSSPKETNQSVRNLLGGYRELVAAGLDDQLAQHPMVLRAIGRSATATRAAIGDLSKASFTLMTTMGIKPEGLADELDRMAFMGKKGQFELNDMAKFLPSIGAAAKDLGLQGTEGVLTLGAAFQVATKTAGDNAEAANNLRNLLLKMTSRETVDNFRKAGVDLKKVLKDSMAKGENPFEAMLDVIEKKTKGDPFKISALFPDQQAQMALKAMLQNRDLLRSLKEEGAKAAGVIDKDFSRRMVEAKARTDAFSNAASRLGDAIGGSLLAPLGAIADIGTPVVTWLAEVSEKSPGTTLALTAIGAAITILPPALRLGAYGMRMFGASSAGAAVGVGVMNRALMLNPIGLVVSTLILGAGLIYDNWEPIKNLFSGMWDSARPEWEAFTAFVEDWATLTIAPIRTVLELGKAAFNFAKTGELDMSGVQAVRDEAAAAGGRMWDRMHGEYQRPDFGIDESSMARAAAASAKGQVDVNVNLPNLPKGAQVETNTTGDVGDVFTRTGTQMVLP